MTTEKYLRKEIFKLPAYHLEVQKGIKLNQNESPWDLPVEIKTQVAEELLKSSWNRYPLDEPLLLKKKLAKKLGVWPDNIVLSNGSNVLIQALIMATSIKGTVLIPDPTFSVYGIEAELFGNTVVRVPLENDFSLSKDLILKSIRHNKPDIIFIANPNAPTGNCFEENTLRSVIEESGCLVVIDEAYYPFSNFTCANWLKDYDNLVILRTFSKAYALAGLRLGYLLAEAELCEQIQKCLLPFCIGKMSYVTAGAVLANDDYLNQYTKTIVAERDRVFKAMQSMPNIKPFPSQTNFIMFEVTDPDRTFKKLLKEGVIIRQVNDGRLLTRHLRVSIGAKEENDAFLKAMKTAVW